MSAIKLTQEELNLLNKRRKELTISINGLDNKTLLIKTDATGADAIAILKDGKQQARCVLTVEHMELLAKYYRKYIDIYNLKIGNNRINKAELGFVKNHRYKELFKQMSSESLAVVFRFTPTGLFLEIRNKAKTNIHNIELKINESIEFRKFLLENN